MRGKPQDILEGKGPRDQGSLVNQAGNRVPAWLGAAGTVRNCPEAFKLTLSKFLLNILG